ncbi:MAG TPA: ATP-binding cassette domain-containing protein [Longimicrobiales bacterium]
MSGGVTAAVPELRLEGVAIRHRRRRVVRDLTWRHGAGRVAWLIGENGAGKSSLLRALAGRARPAAGVVTLVDPSGATGARLYYRPAMRLPGGITVAEWRRLIERLGGGVDRGVGVPGASGVSGVSGVSAAPEGRGAGEHPVAPEDAMALLRPDVPPDRRLDRLSTGEAKRLMLEALLGRPASFLFLDEPYEHLSSSARDGLTAILVARARRSVVVVATNQPVPVDAGGPIVRLDGERAVIDLRKEEAPWGS